MAPTPAAPVAPKTAQPAALVRTIAKGGPGFVNEIFTDPNTNTVIRVNAYTKDQLTTAQTNLSTTQAAQLKSFTDQQVVQAKNLTDMLALLV